MTERRPIQGAFLCVMNRRSAAGRGIPYGIVRTNMDMTLTTPALLFPAISLLMLAYTNRFLALARLIRELRRLDLSNHPEATLLQIANLRKRIHLIRRMQTFAVGSFLLCSVSMGALFLGQGMVGRWLFGLSLVGLSISLLISLIEVSISTQAIELDLETMDSECTGTSEPGTKAA